MTAVTWSTAPIPASALAVGDHFDTGDGRLTVRQVESPGRGWTVVTGENQTAFVVAPYGFGDLVTVHVPDEPVDGYNLWRPKPHTFMSGCTCVSRRQDNGNWHVVARLEDCCGHDDVLNGEGY